jgi:hypothetical protein
VGFIADQGYFACSREFEGGKETTEAPADDQDFGLCRPHALPLSTEMWKLADGSKTA